MSAPAARLQRSEGTVHLAFKKRGFQTVLDTLYQQGCYQARFPRAEALQQTEAVLINTSGGLTDGDSLNCEATWKKDTSALITSQAAERIYRSRKGPATIATKLELDSGSSACWLPQETILFDGGRLQRSTNVHMADGASLFAAEIVVMGRGAMGEVVRSASLFDRWRIRRNGQLIFADALLFDDAFNRDLEMHFGRDAIAGGHHCFATLVYVNDQCAESLTVIRDILSGSNVIGGASDLGPLAVARIVASSSQQMRSVVAAIFHAIQGNTFQLPRVWNC